MSNTGGNNPARLGGGGANNAMFDGIGIIDTGSNSIQLTMNMEAVGEVKVLVSNYQAEYGRSSGVQISAVTKSGTNQFRGSVYDIERNSDWNSNSWQNKRNGNPKTISKERDWGYSIGGPVGKPGGSNKLFFFFSQEWRPRDDRRTGHPVPRADRAGAPGGLLPVAGQQRRPLPLHPRLHDRAPVQRDRTPPAVSRTAASSAGSRRAGSTGSG